MKKRTLPSPLLAAAPFLVLASALGARAEDTTTYRVDLPAQLQTGSQLGAGVDPAASSEIVHPSNPAGLAAGLKQLGGVFSGNTTSATLQLDPYLLAAAESSFYGDLEKARQGVLQRLAMDTAVTLTAAAGAPFQDADRERFATVGFGASVELLGLRSVFSPAFSQCLTAQEQKVERAMIEEKPPQPRPGQPSAEYDDFKERFTAALTKELAACRAQVVQPSNAVFLSYGTRFVTPSVKRQEGDRVQVQRHFGAVSFEIFTDRGFEVTLQGRVVSDRPRLNAPMAAVADAGLQLKWAGARVAWDVEAVQTVARISGDKDAASVGGNVRVKVSDSLAVGLGVLGRGETLNDALQAFSATVSVSFHDSPAFTKSVSF